jgi:hypothetical protein
MRSCAFTAPATEELSAGRQFEAGGLDPRDSEVHQLGLAITQDHDVRRLDVEVHDLLRMRVVQGFRHCRRDSERLPPVEWPPVVDRFRQRAPTQVLDSDEQGARRGIVAHVVNRDDSGMRQACGDLRFGEEPRLEAAAAAPARDDIPRAGQEARSGSGVLERWPPVEDDCRHVQARRHTPAERADGSGRQGPVRAVALTGLGPLIGDHRSRPPVGLPSRPDTTSLLPDDRRRPALEFEPVDCAAPRGSERLHDQVVDRAPDCVAPSLPAIYFRERGSSAGLT